MSNFHCSPRPLWKMSGLSMIALQTSGLRAGISFASWVARVLKNLAVPLRSAWPLEKKKLPPSCLCLAHLCATVLAIVDFPVPATPFNQNMHAPVGFWLHVTISCRSSTRVSLKQCDLCSQSHELKAAPEAQGSLSSSSVPKMGDGRGWR